MAAATTHAGRWGFGILVGVLTVVVRITNPSYYEGVVFAILLASVFSPLFDYVVVERNIKRRKARNTAHKSSHSDQTDSNRQAAETS